MANESWYIDPATRDYVNDGAGNPVIDTTLKTPSYIRVMTPRQKWLYAPDVHYGSDFSTLKTKNMNNTPAVGKAIAQRALQPILDDGRAFSISVAPTAQTRNGLALSAKLVDASGQIQNLNLPKVG